MSAGPSNQYNDTPTMKNEEVDQLLTDDDFDEPDPNVFKVRNSLHPHKVYTTTTLELHKMIHENLVDLTPPYQRDVVWTENKQIHLIDSIFRNFYVPPVVFAVQEDEDGDQTRVCVDGKQRLTSIVRFFDGSIPHRDPSTNKKFWYTSPDSYKGTRLEIPQYWKDWFASRVITVVEYEKLTAMEEREIFQRVQLGVALMNAEKLKAVSSQWSEWISLLENQWIHNETGLLTRMQFETKRARDFQNLVGLVYCCHGLPQENLPSSQKVEKWLSSPDAPAQKFQEDIDNALRELWVIAGDDKYNQGFNKTIATKVAPIEFIFIGVLLYELRGVKSREVKAEAIYILRHAIRELFKDIKNNDVIGKAMWKLVGSLREHPTRWLSKKPPSKRKRVAQEEDSEEEFRPSRTSKKSSKSRGKHAK